MSRRLGWLVAAAIAMTLVYVACRVALHGSPSLRMVDLMYRGVAEALAALGCFAAATSLDEGDYLRTGWILEGLSYLSLVAASLWRGFAPRAWSTPGWVVTTLFTNAFQVAAMILFARTWAIAGVELPARRRVYFTVAALVVLALAGPPLVINLHDLIHDHQLSAWIGVLSSMGDAIGFVLIAPILMTALALRGGLVARVWVLFTLSMLSWLMLDAQDTIALVAVGIHAPTPDWVLIAFEPFRILACGLGMCAGFAQRWISAGES